MCRQIAYVHGRIFVSYLPFRWTVKEHDGLAVAFVQPKLAIRQQVLISPF